jgi:hypothetical protein
VLGPKTTKAEEFSKYILESSPEFSKIYNQALEAEGHHLDKIAGVGLRKALEYLIKDYSIIKRPNDEENIKKLPLGNVIENYVDDHKVKACAKRAVWLGNDETHYIRKWEDKDISHLKLLIGLTVKWVEGELMMEEYIQDMPDN